MADHVRDGGTNYVGFVQTERNTRGVMKYGNKEAFAQMWDNQSHQANYEKTVDENGELVQYVEELLHS